jgi:hypothetical protein
MPPGEGGKSKSAMPRFQGCLRMSEPTLRMPRSAENVSSCSPPSALLDPAPRRMFVPGERPGCSPKSPPWKGGLRFLFPLFPGRLIRSRRRRASNTRFGVLSHLFSISRNTLLPTRINTIDKRGVLSRRMRPATCRRRRFMLLSSRKTMPTN